MSKFTDFIVKHRNAAAVACTPVVMSLVSVASFAEETPPDISSGISAVTSSLTSISGQVALALVAMAGAMIMGAAAWFGLKYAIGAGLKFMAKIFS